MQIRHVVRQLLACLLSSIFANTACAQNGRWSDLGYGLPGQLGVPSLQATPAKLGRMLNVHADDVPGFLLSVCVFGSSRIDAPVFGGVVVPEPLLLISGVATAATRQTYQLLLPDVCLSAPFELFAQVVVLDPAAPQGWSFSNALGTTVRENIPSDFNGDGYSDLAVGVREEDVQGVRNAGAVNVVYGSANGLTAADNVLLRPGKDVNGTIGGAPGTDDRFGDVLATGDFNGDGFDDLAVGVAGASFVTPGVWILNHGEVRVIYGSAVGLQGGAAGPDDQHFEQGLALGEIREQDDLFGDALASGDFDGDGYDDLAVGVRAEDLDDTDCGLVHVLFGSASGLAGSAQYARPTGTEPGDNFGWALAMGDLDGDGLDELVVGSPWAQVGAQPLAGVVSVLRRDIDGNLSSYELHRDSVLGGLQVAGASSEAGFGYTLTAADFSRDGALDLVVGAPIEDINGQVRAGSVHLFRNQPGSPWPFADAIWHQDSPGVIGQTSLFDYFGSELGNCDYDGDGLPDLVIGCPSDELLPGVGGGSVTILRGSAVTGITATNDTVLTYVGLGLGTVTNSMRFGYAVTAGRYGGGCVDELVIGVPGLEINGVEAGGIVVVGDGVPAVEWSQAPLAGQLNAGDFFGGSLGF